MVEENLLTQIHGVAARRFGAAQFSGAVVEVAAKLVPATIKLWSTVTTKMLPTPSKFHYLFNMRELSRVFQVRARTTSMFWQYKILPKFVKLPRL